MQQPFTLQVEETPDVGVGSACLKLNISETVLYFSLTLWKSLTCFSIAE